jgi:hypothetical protein
VAHSTHRPLIVGPHPGCRNCASQDRAAVSAPATWRSLPPCAAARRGLADRPPSGPIRSFPTADQSTSASFCPDHGARLPVRGLDDRDETRQCHLKGVLTSRRFGQRLRTMTATSIGRIAVSSLVLVAACVATLVFGTPRVWREQPVETGAAPAAPAVAPPASNVGDERSTAPTTAPALAVPPRAPGSGDGIMPGFDISLIGRAGDAVIAGRAAPGATVELLRNGEFHDRVVADQSGQFVMVPPRLPPGDYELTLRSTQPDGKQATSQQSVAVSLQPSLKDQPDVALMTPDKASVGLSQPVAPSAICHPSRARKR